MSIHFASVWSRRGQANGYRRASFLAAQGVRRSPSDTVKPAKTGSTRHPICQFPELVPEQAASSPYGYGAD
eukprot:6126902-Pleurochrysis_carterae.AAC.1